jgi:hypothetical protein
MRAAPRPISIADVAEVCLEDRLENARHRLLKQAVADRGNPQRPRTGLARPLGYLYPPNRRSTVGSGFKPFADLLYSQFQLALKLLDALPVDSTCSVPIDRFPSLLEKLRCEQMCQ